MNWFKKRKLLKKLFNETSVFHKAKNRWYFETELKDEESIALIKEFMKEYKRNT